jgi:hypothetical protein
MLPLDGRRREQLVSGDILALKGALSRSRVMRENMWKYGVSFELLKK